MPLVGTRGRAPCGEAKAALWNSTRGNGAADPKLVKLK